MALVSSFLYFSIYSLYFIPLKSISDYLIKIVSNERHCCCPTERSIRRSRSSPHQRRRRVTVAQQVDLSTLIRFSSENIRCGRDKQIGALVIWLHLWRNNMNLVDENLQIVELRAQDIRWPTSKGGHGSDAMVRERKRKFNSSSNRLLFFQAPRSRLFLRLRHSPDQRRGLWGIRADLYAGSWYRGGVGGGASDEAFGRRWKSPWDLFWIRKVLAKVDQWLAAAMDRSGEGCNAPGCGCHHQRLVGPLGEAE